LHDLLLLIEQVCIGVGRQATVSGKSIADERLFINRELELIILVDLHSTIAKTIYRLAISKRHQSLCCGISICFQVQALWLSLKVWPDDFAGGQTGVTRSPPTHPKAVERGRVARDLISSKDGTSAAADCLPAMGYWIVAPFGGAVAWKRDA